MEVTIRVVIAVLCGFIISNFIRSMMETRRKKKQMMFGTYLTEQVRKRHIEMLDAGRYAGTGYIWYYANGSLLVTSDRSEYDSIYQRFPNVVEIAQSDNRGVQFVDGFEVRLDV